jgi:hypothetical protein
MLTTGDQKRFWSPVFLGNVVLVDQRVAWSLRAQIHDRECRRVFK